MKKIINKRFAAYFDKLGRLYDIKVISNGVEVRDDKMYYTLVGRNYNNESDLIIDIRLCY